MGLPPLSINRNLTSWPTNPFLSIARTRTAVQTVTSTGIPRIPMYLFLIIHRTVLASPRICRVNSSRASLGVEPYSMTEHRTGSHSCWSFSVCSVIGNRLRQSSIREGWRRWSRPWGSLNITPNGLGLGCPAAAGHMLPVWWRGSSPEGLPDSFREWHYW